MNFAGAVFGLPCLGSRYVKNCAVQEESAAKKKIRDGEKVTSASPAHEIRSPAHEIRQALAAFSRFKALKICRCVFGAEQLAGAGGACLGAVFRVT